MVETPAAPLILCLECSTLLAGVALYRGAIPLAQQTWTRLTTHGEHLTPSVEMIFQLAHLKISDLDVIAVGIGPGSFTGVRIAVNTAKSLAYAAQKPVLGFSTLHILAQNERAAQSHSSGSKIYATMDALNGNLYAAVYSVSNTELVEERPPQLAAPAEIEMQITLERANFPVTVAGILDPNQGAVFPKVEALAALALDSYQKHRTLNWNQLAPLYIRASSAEEKMGKLNERAKNISSKS